MQEQSRGQIIATTTVSPSVEAPGFQVAVGLLALFFVGSFSLVLVLWYLAVPASLSFAAVAVIAGVAAVFSPLSLPLLPGMMWFTYQRQGYSRRPWLLAGAANTAGGVSVAMAIGIWALFGNRAQVADFSVLGGAASPKALMVLGLAGSVVFIMGVMELVRALFIQAPHRPVGLSAKPPSAIGPGYLAHFGYGALYVAAGIGIVGPLLAAAALGARDLGPGPAFVALLLFVEMVMLGFLACCVLGHRPRHAARISPWRPATRPRLAMAGYQILAGFFLIMIAYDPDWFLAAFLPGGA